MGRRKTIAYLLTFIALLPLIFNTGLQAFQLCIKYGVEARLANEELVNVSVPLAEVHWMEEGREIMVNGKMFDIKHYEEKQGWLLAEGVYDEGETIVVNMLQHFGDKEQNNLVINLLLLTQTFIVAMLLYSIVSRTILKLKHFIIYLLGNATPVLETLGRPPR